MSVYHNPNIVRDGLLCYIDVNNKRCYPGSNIFFYNLSNLSEQLTAVFSDNFKNDGVKQYLANNVSNRWALNFNNKKSLRDFTIQFWVNFKDFPFSFSPNFNPVYYLLQTTGLSAVAEFNEITYNGQTLLYEGEPLVFASIFDVPTTGSFNIIVNARGCMGYFYNTARVTSNNLSFSGDRDWNLFTMTKKASIIKLYKNKSYEEFSVSDFFIPFEGLIGFTTLFNSNHICLYDRALDLNEVITNYNAFKNRYKSERYVDPDAIDYLNRANIVEEGIRNKIYKFIINLKEAKLWDSLVAGWLLSKDYNIGNGLSAISLKDSNTAVMRPGFNNTMPLWSEKGILFTDDGAGDGVASEGPRMEVPYWNSPNLSAPMSMTLTFATSANASLPSQSYSSCLFGKTSYGWGAEKNHFGFNVEHLANVDALMATYFVYDPDELPSRRSGTFRYKFLGGPSVFSMLGMSTDSNTVSTFLDNYTYATTDYFPSTGFIWDNRIKFDNVKFSGSFSGVINNREFRGIISSAFIFNKQIDYKQFYDIYNSAFPEFNLPAFT